MNKSPVVPQEVYKAILAVERAQGQLSFRLNPPAGALVTDDERAEAVRERDKARDVLIGQLEGLINQKVNQAIKKTIHGDFVKDGKLDNDLVAEFIRD